MKLIISFIPLIIFLSNALTQTVKTKDGVSVGLRREFISSCTITADQETMNLKGMEINTFNYCSCVCDNLIPTLYSFEMEKAIIGDKLLDLFLNDKNLKIVIDCLENNYKIDDDFKFEDVKLSEVEQKVTIRMCVLELLTDPENSEIWSTKKAEEYCTCAIDKLFNQGYTYKDILEIENENSESFNEIAIPCIENILYDLYSDVSSNKYNSKDIIGENYLSKVSLVDYLGQGYKIKISFDGISKYFLFDTGASDLIINSDLERDLLLNGSLKIDDYLDTEFYTLANNQTVKARLVLLHNVKIGDYIVNNVIAAIFDEGLLLCGIGFLDKFRKWELDKENKLLILYR